VADSMQYRTKRKEKGLYEIRSLWAEQKEHKQYKSHVRTLMKLRERGFSHQWIARKLAALDIGENRIAETMTLREYLEAGRGE